MHHFSNVYGESSEACKGDRPGLTEDGRKLVRELFRRNMIAGTGGTTGIIYWKDQIGEARVDNVVEAIMQAYCDLAWREGIVPAGGFHRIENASRHVSLGSDWDGSALNAIDAAHVAAITTRLRARRLAEDDIANILGRNACRVVAQSLSGGSFVDAQALCSRYGAPRSSRSARTRQAARRGSRSAGIWA